MNQCTGPYILKKCSKCKKDFWSIGGKEEVCFSCRSMPLPSPNTPAGASVALTGDEMPCKAAQTVLFTMLQELAEYCESDVVFVTCHGKRECVPGKVDDRLHIFSMMLPAWCPYVIKKFDDIVLKINGKEYPLPPGQRDFVDPVEDEIPNCDGIYDDNGILMAVVVGFNIYILNDIMHCDKGEALISAIDCLKHIIDQAVKMWVREDVRI